MNIFKSAFADDISAMLDYRDALGHSKYSYEKLLFRFDNYCIEYLHDEQVLTHEIVVSWLEYEEKTLISKPLLLECLGNIWSQSVKMPTFYITNSVAKTPPLNHIF